MEFDMPKHTRRKNLRHASFVTFKDQEPNANRSEVAAQAGEMLYAVLTTDKLIKIGYTSNLFERKRGYGDAKILAFMPGNYQDEQAIHRALVEDRARGHEYYRSTDEVLEVVNAMRDYCKQPRLKRKPIAA